MNCRPRELAYLNKVPASLAEIRGRVVRVLVPGTGPAGRCVWSIEGRLDLVLTASVRDSSGATRYCGESVWMDQVEDEWLTPIRPGDGEDEILRTAGKPEAVSA